MVPQKQQRPLVLMHLCKDCALFSVRRQPPNANNNGIRQTLVVAAPFSSSESDSSPFNSPASSADNSSPDTSELPSPKPAYVRHRSHSECIETSPVKSILKRRPMFRSLSECAEENFDMLKYYGQSLEDVSESDSRYGDDVLTGSPESLNGFKKKSVSFSERVEENFFRPNSSILGQRKKNQRKNKARKRRESTDSILSSEENEDDNRNNTIKSTKSSADDANLSIDDDFEKLDPAVTTNSTTTTAIINNSSIPPDDSLPRCEKVDVEVVENDQTKSRKNNSKDVKSSKKKCKDRKNNNNVANLLLSDNRYKGFVIGVQQRRSSADSALSASGTDDDDNDFVIIGDNERHRSSLELKDSGIDDEMEELCAQMTAAVVSA